MPQEQLTIVVGLVTNAKGEILLAKRNQPELKYEHGKWEFPGGGIKPNETPEKALIREVWEETGLKVKIIRLLPKIYSHLWKDPKGNRQIIIISYLCTAIGGKLTTKLEKEIMELKFVHPRDIGKYKTLPQIRPSFKEFAKFLSPKSYKLKPNS